jgi:uncharacterized protein YjeT (DUF2065 family)
MDPGRWITLAALSLFLVEGFALAVFPHQFKQLLIEADPRALQLAGLVETLVAAGLIAGVAAG